MFEDSQWNCFLTNGLLFVSALICHYRVVFNTSIISTIPSAISISQPLQPGLRFLRESYPTTALPISFIGLLTPPWSPVHVIVVFPLYH